MSITPEKKEFLKYIAGGLSTLMNGSMLAEEIYTSYRNISDEMVDPTELYINDNILYGSSFSENRFCKAMETIDKGTLWELLTYFDSRDMNISQVYIESCLVPSDLPEELQKFTESIDYKEIQTFSDFLEL
jgi:hypothetical protein|tara:strand:- start:516 stop:908 length:393 start_codon:yes stop_codon:yes gene_type:complete